MTKKNKVNVKFIKMILNMNLNDDVVFYSNINFNIKNYIF